MKLTPITTALLAGLSISSIAHADITPQWQANVEPVDLWLLDDAVTDLSGATYVLTFLEVGPGPGDIDLGIIRVNPDGTNGWETSFAGPVGQDVPEAITMSWDQSAVYVLGRSSVPGFGNSDYAIIKYDALTGAMIWSKFVDGGDQGIDSPSDIAGTPDGGVVVTGGFDTANEQRDFGTVKLDSDGNTVWSRLWTGQGPFLFENDDAELVVVYPNGDVVISGNTSSFDNTDIMTIKYDGSDGTTLWERRYSTTLADVARDLTLTPDGDVVLLGQDPFGFDHQWLVAKYDGETGAVHWETLVDPGQDDSQRAVTVAADGTVFATGGTDPDGDDSNGNENLIAIAYEGDTGAVRWITEWGDGGNNEAEFGNAIHSDAQGNLFVAGNTSSNAYTNGPFDTVGLMLQLDPDNGSVLDMGTVTTSAGQGGQSWDSFRFMGVDADGNMYATGTSNGGNGNQILVAQFGGQGCAPDLTGDGELNFFDVSAFLSAFASQDFIADFTGDGELNFFDVSAFLATFAAGCP